MTVYDEIVPEPGERHLIYGTSGSGKSCHVDSEMRYVQYFRPEAMQLLLDTKPRFRAETVRGKYNFRRRQDAGYLYRHWQKGPVIPNSVYVDIYAEHPFRGLWTRPGEIAIMQSGDANDWRRMLLLASRFAKVHVDGRERRLVADEVLDFYGRTTWSIKPDQDVFYLAARTGRERNIGIALGAQRVHGLPPLVRNMASRVTLYHLDEDKDMRYLNANGIPDGVSPRGNFAFRQWKKERGGTMALNTFGVLEYPESYLEQLVAA